MEMRTVAALLLVALAALADGEKPKSRAKRELLVRSKRRWVLNTIDINENEPGPYPKMISKLENNMTHTVSNHIYEISGKGVDEDPKGLFFINPKTGVVFASRPVDREENHFFHIKFHIRNEDTGLTLDKELAFDVEVGDVNDNPPVFIPDRKTADVPEDIEGGFLPVILEFNDPDKENTPNSDVSFKILSQNPAEPRIGVKKLPEKEVQLTFQGCFDYDKGKKYDIVIEAKDAGKPRFSSSGVVTLNIIDKNTHLPVFKERKYKGEVMESTIQKDIMRVAVEDKDTPHTPAWKAVYSFSKGNEEGIYQVETDPETNEGIISVIKLTVKNEDPLFVCKDKLAGAVTSPQDTISVTVKVKDVNDPPTFKRTTHDVYHKEEEEPGKLLWKPEVFDEENNRIRYELLTDPAGWAEINGETGEIKAAKKMDKESPFVNEKGVYNITIAAIDDGEPPGTATCTLLINLGDINDNKPSLVHKDVVMCGNRVDKVKVAAKDPDGPPFSGPFVFSLKADDGDLQRLWKLDPAVGNECGLVSLKALPYGNYSVPLVIEDQQSVESDDTVVVIVCDCGKADVCRPKEPISSSLGGAAIGLILAGLLLFLLLLLLFVCQCGKKFNSPPVELFGGNQTLIKYNQEGGGAEYLEEPSLFLTQRDDASVTDGLKQAPRQFSQMEPVMAAHMPSYNSSQLLLNHSGYGKVPTDTLRSLGHQSANRFGYGKVSTDTLRSLGPQSMYSTWNPRNTNTYKGASSEYRRSISLNSDERIAKHIAKSLHTTDTKNVNYPIYQLHEYAFEGDGSTCQSLDKLSLSNVGDDLHFLDDMGDRFTTLGNICHKSMQEKKRFDQITGL